MRRIVVLGSTGSIGRQTLDIVRAFPDEFEVVGLSGGNNTELLKQQVEEFRPQHVWSAAGGPEQFPVTSFTPMEQMVALNRVDQVMVALMGSVGLTPDSVSLGRRENGGPVQQGTGRDGREAPQAVRGQVWWAGAAG